MDPSAPWETKTTSSPSLASRISASPRPTMTSRAEAPGRRGPATIFFSKRGGPAPPSGIDPDDPDARAPVADGGQSGRKDPGRPGLDARPSGR